jgi:hypothetical protein
MQSFVFSTSHGSRDIVGIISNAGGYSRPANHAFENPKHRWSWEFHPIFPSIEAAVIAFRSCQTREVK